MSQGVAAIPIILGLVSLSLFLGFHKIDEGYVGIYYRWGKLQNVLSEPGFNFMIPYITEMQAIQTSIQTDSVEDIPCGTSGGVMINFEKIEVVNRLNKKFVIETVRNYSHEYDKIWIYDKIHHEINQFCSNHTLQEIIIEQFETLDEELIEELQKSFQVWIPGLDILAIRVTKPQIPKIINDNFELQEAERTRLIVAKQQKETKIQEAKNLQQQKIIKARSDLEVAKIQIKNQIGEKENQLKMSKIENEIYLNTQKTQIDSKYNSDLKQIQTLKERLSQEYLNYKSLEALTSNLEIVIGDKIPNIFVQGAVQTPQNL